MKEKQLRPSEIAWNQQKVENHRLNEAIYTGWDGGVYRRGIPARLALRSLLKGGHSGETNTKTK